MSYLPTDSNNSVLMTDNHAPDELSLVRSTGRKNPMDDVYEIFKLELKLPVKLLYQDLMRMMKYAFFFFCDFDDEKENKKKAKKIRTAFYRSIWKVRHIQTIAEQRDYLVRKIAELSKYTLESINYNNRRDLHIKIGQWGFQIIDPDILGRQPLLILPQEYIKNPSDARWQNICEPMDLYNKWVNVCV